MIHEIPAQMPVIEQMYNGALGEIVENRNLAQYGKVIADGIFNNNGIEMVIECLQTVFANKPWEQHEATCTVIATVKAMAYIEAQPLNIPLQEYVNEHNWFREVMQSRAGQPQTPQQPQYQQPNQPYYQQPQYQQPVQQNVQQYQQPINNVIRGSQPNNSFESPLEKRRNDMDRSQFVPAHAEIPVNTPKGKDYTFDTLEPKPVPEYLSEEVVIQVKPLKLLNSLDVVIDGTDNAGIARMFTAIPEIHTQSVLCNNSVTRYLPCYNPSTDIVEFLSNIKDINSLEEYYDLCTAANVKLNVKNLIGFLDSFITRTIVEVITYRYDMEDFNMGNYKDDREEINSWLSSKGCLEDIIETVIEAMHNLLGEITLLDCKVEGGESNTFIEATSNELTLTIPYGTIFSSEKNTLWSDGCSPAQLNELLDQCFELAPELTISITLIDAFMNSYKCIRLGGPTLSATTYVIEQT